MRSEHTYLNLTQSILIEILNKDYRSIVNMIKDEWYETEPEYSLKIIKGPMACGSVVVQNEDVITRFIDPHHYLEEPLKFVRSISKLICNSDNLI